MKKLRFLCLGLIFFVCTSLFACEGFSKSSTPREKICFEYFDTATFIYDYSKDTDSDFERNCNSITNILSDYHKLFDIYNEYSDINNLCTLNKNAGGEPIKLDERLIDFLIYAKELYYKTNGEMNVMMGAVLRLWHNARERARSEPQKAYIPEKKLLEAAAEHTSIESLVIDKAANTAKITDIDASIDVGALGKGYATERAAELLKNEGINSYVLDVGGNIRIIGTKPNGDGWVTGITDPQSVDQHAHFVNLSDTSSVTSGDYERYFTFEGKKYHHIIDKDTLMPSEHFSSVTVITPDSGIADALSTALFCMSYEEGLELLKEFSGVDVLWIEIDGTKHLTDGLK